MSLLKNFNLKGSNLFLISNFRGDKSTKMVKEMVKILLITSMFLLNFVEFSQQGPHGIKDRTTPNQRLSKNKKVFDFPNSPQTVSNFPKNTYRKLSRKKRFITETLGQALHMFSRFLSLRFFLSKFSLFCFSTR